MGTAKKNFLEERSRQINFDISPRIMPAER